VRLSALLGGRSSGSGDSGAPLGSAAEQRQALALLRDYEQSGLGWFWSSDSEGKITYVSEVVAKCMGVPRTELIGKPIQSLFVLERDDEETVERTLPLILSARKTFSDLPVRAAREKNAPW